MITHKAAALAAALCVLSVTAHATSFKCEGKRSETEMTICREPALSALDDLLGELYRQARAGAKNKRAFMADSDAKWTWRETHCTDTACLTAWYLGRADELRRSIADESDTPMQAAKTMVLPHAQVVQVVQVAQPGSCTAANPGMPSLDDCKSVMNAGSKWKLARKDEWFCGVAAVAQSHYVSGELASREGASVVD